MLANVRRRPDALRHGRTEPFVAPSIKALEDAVVLEVSTPDRDDVVGLCDLYGRLVTD